MASHTWSTRMKAHFAEAHSWATKVVSGSRSTSTPHQSCRLPFPLLLLLRSYIMIITPGYLGFVICFSVCPHSCHDQQNWALYTESQGVSKHLCGDGSRSSYLLALLISNEVSRSNQATHPTSQLMVYIQVLFLLHNCCVPVGCVCVWHHSRTGKEGMKKGRRSRAFTELCKLFGYPVLALQRQAVSNENRWK